MSGRPIDWGEIHRKLERTRSAIETGFSPSPEATRRTLRERAILLARQPDRQEDEQSVEFVVFKLANGHYGIESGYVREVYPLKEYTPLPCTPAFVLGLINVRGRILSVIDIGKFFEMPDQGISDLNKVIIIHGFNMEFGILADAIVGVRNIDLQNIQPSLPTLKGTREKFLKGIVAGPMVLLDAGKILTEKSIVVHEEA